MIYFREDRNRFVVSVGKGEDRVRREVRTREDAVALEQALIESGLKQKDRESFVSACKEYIDVRSSKKVTGKSEIHWLRLLDIFLEERSIEYLDEIRPKHIEALQAWLMRDHEFYSEHVKRHRAVKESSVNRIFSSYRNFFSWCVSNDMLAKSPCLSVKQMEYQKPEIELITDVEYASAVKLCPDWFLFTFRFIYLTGMPPSSMARIKWKHVDIERSRIVYFRRKGAQARYQEKHFPLVMSELVELLNGQRERLIAKGAFLSPESFVFTNRNLTPISAERISKVANSILKRVGAKGTLYSLRHRLVSDLIEAGVGIEQAAQLVGHSDIRTTRNYSHQQSMAVLNRHLETVRGEGSLSEVRASDLARTKEGVS